MFYKQLKAHYSQRKYREQVTLGCAKRCLKEYGFREDDLSKNETSCLQDCFHKYYRYLAYSNTLYTYMVEEASDAVLEEVKLED